MGSSSDMVHCEKIRQACKGYGVPCELRVSSAHKGTDETMKILAQYEGKVVSLDRESKWLKIGILYQVHTL